MEQTIVSLQLPVQEALEIRKNRIAPPAGQDRGNGRVSWKVPVLLFLQAEAHRHLPSAWLQ